MQNFLAKKFIIAIFIKIHLNKLFYNNLTVLQQYYTPITLTSFNIKIPVTPMFQLCYRDISLQSLCNNCYIFSLTFFYVISFPGD